MIFNFNDIDPKSLAHALVASTESVWDQLKRIINMNESKKYRLKKWYPSLPEKWKGEEGLIIEKNDAEYYFHPYKPLGTGIRIKAEEVENNSEFWEKVKEKDYEILSVKGNGKLFNEKREIYKNTYKPKEVLFSKKTGTWVDPKNLTSGYEIHSVKRLSDGEIFTVGDEVIAKHWGESYRVASITRIFLCEDNYIRVECSNGCSSALKYFIPCEKPLFTTEDGVDIYEGDDYWIVHSTNSTKTSRRKASRCTRTFKDELYFSTEEKAEEYVEDHKPRYSKADIKEAIKSFKIECKDLIKLRTEIFLNQLEVQNNE